MKKIIQLSFAFISLVVATFSYAASSPIGSWTTIDDVTHKPKSIINIYQSGRAIYGRVVKIYPRPGYDQNEVCSACKGSLHNQRIVGMVVMQGLVQDVNNPSEWSGGSILDPLNGKTYRCTIKVSNDNRTLNVRGYVGISMFGRTQTWIRAR